ncbi:MAG: hypothetical protein EBX40_07230 [Gammaproteobacteria bacterium]|nr:hypothetical protein [Gammaproteobacteria bacterium]
MNRIKIISLATFALLSGFSFADTAQYPCPDASTVFPSKCPSTGCTETHVIPRMQSHFTLSTAIPLGNVMAYDFCMNATPTCAPIQQSATTALSEQPLPFNLTTPMAQPGNTEIGPLVNFYTCTYSTNSSALQNQHIITLYFTPTNPPPAKLAVAHLILKMDPASRMPFPQGTFMTFNNAEEDMSGVTEYTYKGTGGPYHGELFTLAAPGERGPQPLTCIKAAPDVISSGTMTYTFIPTTDPEDPNPITCAQGGSGAYSPE